MRAEASTILRAVASDFFFICWYLEIPSDNCIRHIQRFKNFYIGSGSRTPDLYSVSPDWFEYCFIYEKFVACGEF
jgi:hypothetical protein